MKRKHEFIKNISQPLNTLGFKVSKVQIYEVCIFFFLIFLNTPKSTCS